MSYIVVSGLPGSGKSTLARRLAPLLSLPVLDKDDILGSLFESSGVGDAAWRSKLSRLADEEFCRAAAALGSGILVSWWRHPGASGSSGTPTAWLSSLPAARVEIYCVCSPRVAAARFAGRTRHPGHLDATRPIEELIDEFSRLAALGPLGCGAVLSVATDADIDLEAVLSSIRA